jgi:hypothetical protein
MKPDAEMHEGTEALTRFENTMRALFSKRKADVFPEKTKRSAARKKIGKPKA